MVCLRAHRPVLLTEVLKVLTPSGREVFLDCTVGSGGHAEAILEAAGGRAQLVGIDWDSENLQLARRRLERFGDRVRLFEANFAHADTVLARVGQEHTDALLADLGISSVQLDDPDRGLSFSKDGPLDMRLSSSPQRQRQTAEQLVNTLPQDKLADLIYEYGQERYSRRIARAIVAAREKKRIKRTGELAETITGAIPRPARKTRRGVHPATRTFLALRIAVNGEMENLDGLLSLLPRILAPGGRAAMISFHSLEDRRVKRAFAAMVKSGLARHITKKPIVPTERERNENRRSRSAKLRAIEKLSDNPSDGEKQK